MLRVFSGSGLRKLKTAVNISGDFVNYGWEMGGGIFEVAIKTFIDNSSTSVITGYKLN